MASILRGNSRHLAVLTVGIATFACIGWAEPAAAQFGSIFGPPPRPPGEVPGARYPVDQGDPRYYPAPQPRYERAPRYEDRGRYDPDYEPAPPPLTRFPQSSPPARAPASPPARVRGEPLPPPPGAAPAPVPPAAGREALPPQRDLAVRPGQAPLSGLPPGQRQPRGGPQNTAPQPGDEVVVAPPAQKIVNGTAVFSGLDKITGRIISFDVAIDETVQFGALRLTPRACYTRPPSETPNTDGFIEVDEITLQGEVKRLFTGWMFAASPGLHGIEHAIYDVWLTDCKKDSQVAQHGPGEKAEEPAAEPAPAPPPAPAQRPAARPRASAPPAPRR
jgi:hypothetical protein